MAAAITALILFAVWAVVLAMVVVGWRLKSIAGGTSMETFTAGIPHGTGAYWRANRAQANAVENLPIFASVVLAGAVLGVDTGIIAALAVTATAARVVQSLIHIASASVIAVNLRALAWMIQLVCFVWIAIEVILQAGLL